MLNNNNKLEFLDLLSMASFCISLMNLEENISQGDMQDLEQNFNTNLSKILNEIHGHLEVQDSKLEEILKRLKELEK